MNYWFSPEKNAFYPKDLQSSYIRAGTLPDNLIDIDDAVFNEFSGMAPSGKMRGTDDNNYPCWVDLPVPAVSAEALKAQARKFRDNFIFSTDRMLLEDYTINDMLLSAEQRSELLRVRASFKSWPECDGWPEIELPEIPQWILTEAVNNGYVIPHWPD